MPWRLSARCRPRSKVRRSMARFVALDFEGWLDGIARGEGVSSWKIAVVGILLRRVYIPTKSLQSTRRSPICLFKPSPSVEMQADLHHRFVEALGEQVKHHSPLSQKPLELDRRRRSLAVRGFICSTPLARPAAVRHLANIKSS